MYTEKWLLENGWILVDSYGYSIEMWRKGDKLMLVDKFTREKVV